MSFGLLYLELLMSENIGIPRPPKRRTGNDSNFRSADEVVRLSLMAGINFVSML